MVSVLIVFSYKRIPTSELCHSAIISSRTNDRFEKPYIWIKCNRSQPQALFVEKKKHFGMVTDGCWSMSLDTMEEPAATVCVSQPPLACFNSNWSWLMVAWYRVTGAAGVGEERAHRRRWGTLQVRKPRLRTSTASRACTRYDSSCRVCFLQITRRVLPVSLM